MKRVFAVILAVLSIVTLSGCAGNNEHLEQRIAELKEEISVLEKEKIAVENEIVEAKEKNGTAKYVVTFCIRQTHFSLDIGEHIKDAMNEIKIVVPVDKEYYDEISVGDTINEDFRVGSLVMRGSFGSWDVTVDSKEIR